LKASDVVYGFNRLKTIGEGYGCHGHPRRRDRLRRSTTSPSSSS
jgi:hypothetical protein